MRSFSTSLATLAFALGTFGALGDAAATGMQGHIYMAQCAAEQTTDPRLRALFDEHANDLSNGAFFPDSGYTADDHDQGEIAHWEQYVEAYVQTIRERFPAPLETPEGRAHVAFLLGLAAHGITDSTFDSLLYERADQVDPGDMDPFDMAMDIFLVHDKPRYYLPEIAVDAQTQAGIYTDKLMHPVPVENVDKAMKTAWSGISVVANYLYIGADDYGKDFPWARASLLDPRTPGGYPFGARVVLGYYRELLRRLDGEKNADNVVIGVYPDASYPLVTLDGARPDGKITIFFGEGLDRGTIDDNVVVVRDDAGNVVPTTVSIYRGDLWPNVLRVTPSGAWSPETKYTATLQTSIKTLSGTSPTKELVFPFETCTPDPATGDCAAVAGPPPPSPCPNLDAAFTTRPEDVPPDDTGDPPPADAAPDPSESSGCAAAPTSEHALAWPLALFVGAWAAARARRRVRKG